MKTWDRTTIRWTHLNTETVIPFSNIKEGESPRFHTTGDIKAVSQVEDGFGVIDVPIKGFGITAADKAAIIAKLEELKTNEVVYKGLYCDGLWVSGPGEYDGIYKIRFRPGHAGFCDTAIRIVTALYDLILKGGDAHRFNARRFTITRDTLVQANGGWMTFAAYLRSQHRLGPIDDDLQAEAP